MLGCRSARFALAMLFTAGVHLSPVSAQPPAASDPFARAKMLGSVQFAEVDAMRAYEAALAGPAAQRVAPAELDEARERLAGLYFKFGRLDRAIELYRGLVDDAKRRGLPPAEQVARGRTLAFHLISAGRYAEAEPLLRAAVAAAVPANPLLGSADREWLATTLALSGDRKTAQQLYEQIVADVDTNPVLKQLGAFRALAVVRPLEKLAQLHADAGEYPRADELLRRIDRDTAAWVKEVQSLGAEAGAMTDFRHQMFGAGVLNSGAEALRARLAAAAGRPHEAAEATDKHRRSRREWASEFGDSVPAHLRAAMVQGDAVPLNESLSLVLAPGADGYCAERTLAWLMNSKGQLQELLARPLQAGPGPPGASADLAAALKVVRDRGNNAKALEVAAALTATRRELARAAIGLDGTARREQCLSLVAYEAELDERLRHAIRNPYSSTSEHIRDLIRAPIASQAPVDPKQPGPSGYVKVQWYEPADLRTRLPKDAAYIDFARFEPFDFRAKTAAEAKRPPRYVAWVLAPGRPVEAVDLAPAAAVDAAVASVRRHLADAPAVIKEAGEPAAEAQTRPALDRLSDLLFRPLLGKLGGATRLVLSPDANLWLVPWAALRLPDGRYAVERYSFTFVVSGRDPIAGPPTAVGPVGPPLIVADPDYGSPLAAAGPEPTAAELRGGARPPLGRVPRLPASAAEADAVRPHLKAFTGIEPATLRGGAATETAVLAHRRPRVLLLSTHGYVLADQSAAPASAAPLSSLVKLDRAGDPYLSPLLRCGLLLAGCNRPPAANGDDGVLTGLEVLTADLRGCELVALNACETGLGDVEIGEGIAGLRQAFQAAGARAVLATLWSVSDRSAGQLSVAFFDGLAAGRPKGEALRAAQLQVLETRRKRNAAAHPFFWAAYTITGAD
ncbi:MAG: CHAT domain-containing protein [Gemmataceae bacterium]